MGQVTDAAAPDFRLYFQGNDMAQWVDPMALTITYTDVLESESDTLDVELMDPEQKWCGPWWPGQGDVLQLQLGRKGGQLRDMGSFVLDEIAHSGPPDKISLKALSAPTDRALRSNKHAGYEDTTLPVIAAEVAARNGLTVVGDLAEVPVKRITQANETDLDFLRRLAHEFGYVFSVKGAQVVFQDVSMLHALPSVRSLAREDIFTWDLAARQADTPGTITESYWDPEQKDLKAFGTAVPGGRADTHTLRGRSENAIQAARRVGAQAARAACGSITGNIDLDGDPILRAGVNVSLSGLGKLDGRYRIDRATHKVDRSSGYTTQLEVSKLP